MKKTNYTNNIISNQPDDYELHDPSIHSSGQPKSQQYQQQPTSKSVTTATLSNRSVEPQQTQTNKPFTSSSIDDCLNNNEVYVEDDVDDEAFEDEPYARREFREIQRSNSKTEFEDRPADVSKKQFQPVYPPKEILSSTPPYESDSDYYNNNQRQSERDQYDRSRSPSSLRMQRKSVSFDLAEDESSVEYVPEFRTFEEAKVPEKLIINDRKNDPRYRPPNPIYSQDRNYSSDEQYSSDPQRPRPKLIKSILRSSSPSVPSSNYSTLERQQPEQAKFVRERINDDDSEIERDNPFRKEYLSQEDLYRDTAEVKPPRPQRPQSSYDPSYDQQFNALRQSFENISQSQSQLNVTNRGSPSFISTPVSKSTGNLQERPAHKPPLPPKPAAAPFKHAELVRNEALDIMKKEMEQGDFVEYEHDVSTNTITEIRSSKILKGNEDFSPDNPLPPVPNTKLPIVSKNIRRVMSVERPTVSPPPPPVTSPKSFQQQQQQNVLNNKPEVFEVVPARFGVLPTKKKAEFHNENAPDTVLVPEDVHRSILLEENELRNNMQFDSNNNNSNILNSTNPFLDTHSISSFSSSSMQTTPNVLSPVSTLERQPHQQQQQQQLYYQQQLPPPPASMLSSQQIFPQSQILPVHYTQLPIAQRPGYLITSPPPPPQPSTQPPPLQHQQQPTSQHQPSTQGYHQQQPQQQYPYFNYPQQQIDYTRTAGYMVSDGSNQYYQQTQDTQQQQSVYMQPSYQQQVQHQPLRPAPPPPIPSFQTYYTPTYDNFNNMTNTNYQYQQQSQQQQHHQQHQTSSHMAPIRLTPIITTNPNINTNSSNNNTNTNSNNNKFISIESPTFESFGKQTSV